MALKSKTFKTALFLSGASLLLATPALAQQAVTYGTAGTNYESRTYGDYTSQHVNQPVTVEAGFENVEAEAEAIRIYQQGLQSESVTYASPYVPVTTQGTATAYEYPLAKTYSSREAALQGIQIELYDTPIPSSNGTTSYSYSDAAIYNAGTTSAARTTYIAPTTTYTGTTSYSGSTSHVVTAGETLYGIGRQYGLKPSVLMNANGLSGSNIKPGQILSIPASATTLVQSLPVQTTSVTNATTRIVNVTPLPGNVHAVLPGDTLYSLARRYCTSPSAIASASGIGTSSVLSLGQQLTLPNGSCMP